ncbi:MAG TPA: hypothetical protein VNN80_15965, partial [Polyangiaceae bacterium]|nr:hypothetical protein [Polyangiaceae bacterium]
MEIRRSSRCHYRIYAGGTLFLLLEAAPARAWVFSEHVEITRRALRVLDTRATPNEHDVLATVERALGLCGEDFSDRCATLATLGALAADHSCTPRGLRATLEDARARDDHWLWRVLQVAADTREALGAAGRSAPAREDIRRQMHVDLQSADSDYLARALVDYSHFQPTRVSGSTADLGRFLGAALAAGRPANATASYVNYHVVALRLAARAGSAAGGERRALLARALSTEAFAVHFLEDSFAAGHFVGHWGDDATRLGTHDYYSAAGVEAVSWRTPTEAFITHGDAFLSDAEADAAAAAVRTSLGQVLRAATDAAAAASLLADVRGGLGEEEYDSCARAEVPAGLSALSRAASLQEVLALEPVPAPRFPPVRRVRAEKGFFLGGAATAALSYALPAKSTGTEVRAALRAGFGAADVVDDPLNAQAFVEAGVVGRQLLGGDGDGSLIGYSFRLRAPGYVFFLDGALAVLLVQIFEADCPFCLEWGATAAGGGLFRIWKSRPLFGSVSWQISALRDVSLNWFRNIPAEGQSRVEIFPSLITARSVLPIAGERWSQSTDFYL